MKCNKLKLLGFKSFVDGVEFHIDDGLTGVVGPNGCGKSNLVEALRWVMGENSYKNMRASGMDDVIFSGSANRPARNTAEVTLFLDNSDRTAPAQFNDADELQISRRIERESGSVYRINGKEARARDVQLLFADASTGARSPSMVGQGRIGELISAKPQSRRALLEEAAGISGLHTRRHEAELRLRSTEANLDRLEDVLAQMDGQIDSLKRQSRQANRYKNLSAYIRRSEALVLHLRWADAKKQEAIAQNALSAATALVAEKAEMQTLAAKEQAILAHKMPQLRGDEAKAAAALQHLKLARNQLNDELSRLSNRREELSGRLKQLADDMQREENLVGENAEILARLGQEEKELIETNDGAQERRSQIECTLAQAQEKLASSEKEFATATELLANQNARKTELERAAKSAVERISRFEQQLVNLDCDLKALNGEISALAEPASISNRIEALAATLASGEVSLVEAEKQVETARQKAQSANNLVVEARSAQNTIETEARTLASILSQSINGEFPAIVESVVVEAGFEIALGAALGEDLDISSSEQAPVHWKKLPPFEGESLPEGVEAMTSKVQAPQELARRLANTGIVDAADGPNLQPLLKPGQCLVSVEGDIWRWDGLVASAEAPTLAAQNLARKNRLAELENEAIIAGEKLNAAERKLTTAMSALEEASENERQSRDSSRAIQRELSTAREELIKAERAVSHLASRKSAMEEAQTRVNEDLKEAKTNLQSAQAAMEELADTSTLEGQLDRLRLKVAEERAIVAEHRADQEGLAREDAARTRRLQAIKAEREVWKQRAENAIKQLDILKTRNEEAKRELAETADRPNEIEVSKRELSSKVETAETARQQAADRLVEAETALREADKRAQLTISELSDAREARARGEGQVEAGINHRKEIEARIRDEMDCHPADALKIAELDEGATLPQLASVESRLEKLRNDRERLGAVNLRADDEQTEIVEKRDQLIAERDDLIEAIKRLRRAIQSLNREGRERLLEAFDVVNGQFQRLFTHLFGGGTAELQLVESDDPLEAGLDILARPPGKKPQTMTLLSGGEQALTAMALIFAVFLTNPAPICVLDEVDAPLDDHNVERFCNLMDEMAATTDTKFVIITHNPITMARVNRLYGVTMAERGVSQMVSVDLQQAEQIREAS